MLSIPNARIASTLFMPLPSGRSDLSSRTEDGVGLIQLPELLAHLQPTLHEGTYVYATLLPGQAWASGDVVALIQEPEGTSVIVEEARARALGLVPVLRCAWITLAVNSDLEAVGLTAAFSAVLGQAGIGCNVVAGAHHDHIFVPVHQAQAAMTALRQLQERHSRQG